MRKHKYPPRREVTDFVNNVVLCWNSDECLIWPYATFEKGYACHRLPGSSSRRLSRSLCEVENGSPPTDVHQAAHKCGVNRCVNRRHLYWATPQQNSDDKQRHGRQSRGEDIGNSKITVAAVREIRSLHGRETLRSIASRFGVAETTVSAVVKRKTWGWVP